MKPLLIVVGADKGGVGKTTVTRIREEDSANSLKRTSV